MLGKLFIFVIVLGAANLSAQTDRSHDLDVAPSVDLSRYAGKWYEIARLPNRFQKRCEGNVTATYSQLENRKLKVVNECREKNGRVIKAEGSARLAEKSGPNSRLEVRFAPAWLSWLPMVWGDYWILELAGDYSYTVVGTPDRKFLWILSRAPQISDELYRKLIEQVSAWGFDAPQVVRTRQNI